MCLCVHACVCVCVCVCVWVCAHLCAGHFTVQWKIFLKGKESQLQQSKDCTKPVQPMNPHSWTALPLCYVLLCKLLVMCVLQMRLRLDFRGVCDGEDIFSSVFVVLQKGEFDQEIPFPFNGQVKVTLIAQNSNRNSTIHHVSTIINCKDIPRNNTGSINARVNSRGRTRFIKQKELLSPIYNKNNVLFFDVSMVSQCEITSGMPNTNILVSPLSPLPTWNC